LLIKMVEVGAGLLLIGATAALVATSGFEVIKMIFGSFRDAKGFDRVALGVVLVILCGAELTMVGVTCGFVMMQLWAG